MLGTDCLWRISGYQLHPVLLVLLHGQGLVYQPDNSQVTIIPTRRRSTKDTEIKNTSSNGGTSYKISWGIPGGSRSSKRSL